MTDKPKPDGFIGYLTVGCNPDTVQTIAITCRCKARWTERVPKEIHDSTMVCLFECPACGQQYVLKEKVLKRVDKEDADDRRQQETFNVVRPDNKYDYDA